MVCATKKSFLTNWLANAFALSVFLSEWRIGFSFVLFFSPVICIFLLLCLPLHGRGERVFASPFSFSPCHSLRFGLFGFAKRAGRRCRPARPAFRVRPFRVPARARRHPFPPFPAFPSVRGAPAIVSAPSAAVRLFPVFPEFRAIPFPPAPFRPFSSRGPRPRIYYYKVQPRFPRPFLSNIRKSFRFPSFFSFESLAVRDILVTFALAFGNDVPPGRRVSPANEERVL